MGTAEVETRFLSAHRVTACELTRQIQSVRSTPALALLLNAVSEIIAILNEDRQIIFANQALANYLHLGDLSTLYGLRVGEAFDCIHASQTKGGCGTTEFCTQCGVANATHAAQKVGAGVRECHIARRDGGGDFRVAASTVQLGGERFTVFTVTDVSSENRRRALERIFFHDVLNLASGVTGAAELIGTVPTEQVREMGEVVQRLSKRLISEIQAQRELAAAESGELAPQNETCDPAELVKEVAALYQNHALARNRSIVVEIPDQKVQLVTDPFLVGRVLGNMLKNALEASLSGETAKIGFNVEPDHVVFHVWNPGVMPRIIQLQLFQRSFTTKGTGRGLGTFSMKLLGEKYLGGEVTFSTVEGAGTMFRLRLAR